METEVYHITTKAHIWTLSAVFSVKFTYPNIILPYILKFQISVHKNFCLKFCVQFLFFPCVLHVTISAYLI
jgi:hypothetical protein